MGIAGWNSIPFRENNTNKNRGGRKVAKGALESFILVQATDCGISSTGDGGGHRGCLNKAITW